MKGFGSDNHSGIHPQILQAIMSANDGHYPSYGTDPLSLKLESRFQEIFGPHVRSYLVFNGTAANVLSLRGILQPGQAVLCSDVSHLHQDEGAAPEFFTQGKLLPQPSNNGKLQLSQLKEQIIRKGDQHYSQIKAISLSQPTELGTVYSLEELKEKHRRYFDRSL
jgi:threonine aldolase